MLQLYKNKIIIDKEKLPDLESVKQIVDTFKEEDSLKVLMYMYLVYNRSDENPIKEFPMIERIRWAKDIAFKNTKDTLESLFPKEIKLINKAFKEYESLFLDDLQRQIDLSDKKMYEFIKLLDDNKPVIVRNEHEISGRVTFSTNIDIVTSILDNSIEIILEKAALISLKQTGKFSHALRGGLSLKKKVNKLIRKVNDDTKDS